MEIAAFASAAAIGAWLYSGPQEGSAVAGEVEELLSAASAGLAARVTELVDQGLAVDSRSRENKTALFVACAAAQEKTVDALLSLGADPLARTEDGTAAHAAAAAG